MTIYGASLSLFAVWTDFSAVDIHERRSSIVAMNVGILSHFSFVVTFPLTHMVLRRRPNGVFELSGLTAFVTAFDMAESS